MKKMLFWLDLSLCSVWILNILCGHNYWNQANTIFIALIVLVRLTISFALARNEKKTWIPLLFSAALWGFHTTMNCFNGIGGAGEYFFHITGLEYNWFIEHCITGGLWMWIIVLPTIYYIVLFFRHKLVDTGITKKELCGAILWKDRQARFYCAMMAISFFSFLGGTYMEQRLCQAMCFVSPALFYWVVCRYYKEDADNLWLIIVGSICFWYAQICGGVFRVMILTASFALIAYTCSLLYKKTKQHLLAFCAIMYIGVILPSFSIGYNQYACINYPRRGYYHLAPYSGIIYISDDFNGTHMGLRDRYGLLVKPEYESIRPGKSRWGMPSTYYLEKDGYEVLYNINDNVIYPSDNNPELQKELCGIINTHFENRETAYQDRGEIIITDLRDDKVIGKVRRNRYSDFVWDDSKFLPDDTAEVKCGQFLRRDSINIIGKQYVNMLSYAENIPNDSVPNYRVTIRLAYSQTPDKSEIRSLIDEIKNVKYSISKSHIRYIVMELKTFRPDDKFFDDLVAKFDKEYISLDYRDILHIRRCKDIRVYEAVKDSSFTGNADEFVDTFLKEVKTHIDGRNVDHVLVCMISDNEESILMETLSHLNDFMEIFGEETEARWGLCHSENGTPMQLIVAVGMES